MTTTKSIFNNKGGVGKTTFLFHVAHRLADQGRRVLMVDCDSQCCEPCLVLELATGLIEFDLTTWPAYPLSVNAVEFRTELSGAAVLPIPREIAAQLPKSGKARIIVLTEDATDEAQWRAGAYEQFLRDDSAEDAVYDSLRGSESHPRPLEPAH
jgi:hypothetical protein